MKVNIWIILLSIFLFSAKAHSQEEIIPLAEGNYWKFQNQNGDIEFAKVLEKMNIGGETWFKYRELSDDNIFVVRNTSEGQVETLDDEEDLVLKYPVEDRTLYIQFETYTRVIPNQHVTVPAGKFNAYIYEFSINDPEYNGLFWIAPGVGLVKSQVDDEIFELIEYKINWYMENFINQSKKQKVSGIESC